jgi:hypothetical protein
MRIIKSGDKEELTVYAHYGCRRVDFNFIYDTNDDLDRQETAFFRQLKKAIRKLIPEKEDIMRLSKTTHVFECCTSGVKIDPISYHKVTIRADVIGGECIFPIEILCITYTKKEKDFLKMINEVQSI